MNFEVNSYLKMHDVVYKAIAEIKEGLVYLKNRIVSLDRNQVQIQTELGLVKEQFSKLTTTYNQDYQEITSDLNTLEGQFQQPSDWVDYYSYIQGSRVLYGTDTYEAQDFVNAHQAPPPDNDRWIQVWNAEPQFG